MGLGRYIAKKAAWYAGALVVAVVLNFLLPRLVPGNPVDTIVSNVARGSNLSSEAQKAIYEAYVAQFGLNDPLWKQFFIYVGNVLKGNLGTSFAFYPTSVNVLVGQALPFTLVLQIPAIAIGWIIGNTLGAIAAYKGGNWDKGVFTTSLFFSAMPYYCLSLLLLFGLAVEAGLFPPSGAYSVGTSPAFTLEFIADASSYYWLPFLSLVLVLIGGQAVGMRSMAIYELGSDYVNYSRGLGIKNSTMVGYIFHNASLPQITGLALAIGGMVGGALITELVFNYPGMGTTLFNAISANDYPVIQAITLIITVAVLLANFAVEVLYGFIDPRIRAARTGEK